jgi:hypothetical protein
VALFFCRLSWAAYTVPFFVCIGVASWGWLVGSDNVPKICLFYGISYLSVYPIGMLCSFGCRDSFAASAVSFVACVLFRLATVPQFITCVVHARDAEEFQRHGGRGFDLGAIALVGIVWLLLIWELAATIVIFAVDSFDHFWLTLYPGHQENYGDVPPLPTKSVPDEDGSFSAKPIPSASSGPTDLEPVNISGVRPRPITRAIILAALLAWLGVIFGSCFCMCGPDPRILVGLHNPRNAVDDAARKKMEEDFRKALEDAKKKQ